MMLQLILWIANKTKHDRKSMRKAALKETLYTKAYIIQTYHEF